MNPIYHIWEKNKRVQVKFALSYTKEKKTKKKNKKNKKMNIILKMEKYPLE